MKYTKEFLVGIWVVGKLCGVYLLVLAVLCWAVCTAARPQCWAR